ncbi:putative ATP-dependent RNA helicase DDX10 isoform X2 [Tachypleus tridentatus]|uniref:putative ATP-dependent RNA helicase DDX10 isoform X2 n=1 Tax=Tachypleus tridentatus TaxID=6853 RepID=UPI003FD33AF4
MATMMNGNIVNEKQKFEGSVKKNSQTRLNKNQSIKLYRKKQKRRELQNSQIQKLVSQYEKIDSTAVRNFRDFPLSHNTKLGLKDGGYFEPTEIQKEAIGLALRGLDILGAAKTGSGKTIAFLIPILELLYRERWTRYDGLGALIITPTRELAYQIFEVLRKIGDLKFERQRMDKCNIVICTPGRLLQHMDENPLFDTSNLKVLVLDEADRILDLGFQKTMNAIIENLPQERQTLLFSATQTKSVKDLARLSLKNPVYVSVHENAKHSTPEALKQSYIVCELHEKHNLLWSFIRNHLKQKILVFMASCKQVKYTFEVFCRMRPGASLMSLYGSLHQLRRMAIYDEFCRKEHAVLFATDIAARGLDFPSVNWVVQLDCPEDSSTYIHRAGRTARFQKDGESLLVLLPSEEKPMLKRLEDHKIPIKKIQVNAKKLASVQRKMEALCARDNSLKESAKRCFVAYLKSVFLMKDKKVFNIQSLDTDAYARSLGLAVTPRVRFLQKTLKKQAVEKKTKEENFSLVDSDNGSSSEAENRESKAASEVLNYFSNNESSDEDLFTVKRVITYSDKKDEMKEDLELDLTSSKTKRNLTKPAVAKKLKKKKIIPNKKIVFNEEGEPDEQYPTTLMSETAKELQMELPEEGGINIELTKRILQEEDKFDKQLYRQRIKEVHQEKRRKEKEARRLERGLPTKSESRDKEEENSSSEDEAISTMIDELPDPDKVWGKTLEDSVDDKSTSEDDGTDSSSERNKRKLQQPSLPESKRQKRSEEEISEPLDTGLTLAGDEELALHLLSRT